MEDVPDEVPRNAYEEIKRLLPDVRDAPQPRTRAAARRGHDRRTRARGFLSTAKSLEDDLGAMLAT